MMLKKTALALTLGLGLAAAANANTITNIGTITVPAFYNYGVQVFGEFTDAYNFTVASSAYSAGAVTSIELPSFYGIDNLTVKLWSGTYGDATADTLITTLTGTSITKSGSGVYIPGDYFYTISGIGNGGTSGQIGLGDYVIGVNTAAVPEPETYAMLLAGLGLMGTIARRRNKSKNN